MILRPPPPTLTLAKSNPEFVMELFQEQAAPLLKYLTSRFHDREDAAEIAQEAWLRMYRLDHPEHLSNPRAFLFQMASNLGIDRARRTNLAQRFNVQERAATEQDTHPSAELSAAAQESLALIRNALKELPDNCREAFILHRGGDMSYPEIARDSACRRAWSKNTSSGPCGTCATD